MRESEKRQRLSAWLHEREEEHRAAVAEYDVRLEAAREERAAGVMKMNDYKSAR